MQKKTRLLMQMRDRLGGYAGITQETQLLFSSFLDSPGIEPHGLMIKGGPYDLGKQARGLPAHLANSPQILHKKIKRLSDFIIGYKALPSSHHSLPSKLDLFVLPFNMLFLNTITTLGGSISMDHFDSQGFENFLWDYFFSKTLTTDDYKKVVAASYRTLSYPITLLQLAGMLAVAYPKLDTSEYDIFLAQTPFPVRVAKNTQLVVRYHDAIPMFAPHLTGISKYHQLFHYKALKLNAKKGLFACTSNASRNELLQIMPSLERRSVVIHDIVLDSYFEEEKSQHSLTDIITSRSVHKELLGSFPYLLMVSTIEPRKNHLRLLQAWEIVRASLKLNLKLIIVGKVDLNYTSIIEVMKPWQERGELFHLQNVPTSELRLLYKEAACVVCPSMMEGFGLSGIEAMLCGGKVAASTIPAHQEVYGDAAVYFDPFSVEEQVEAIKAIISPENAAFAESMKMKGLQWGKRYKRDMIIPQWEAFFERVQASEYSA